MTTDTQTPAITPAESTLVAETPVTAAPEATAPVATDSTPPVTESEHTPGPDISLATAAAVAEVAPAGGETEMTQESVPVEPPSESGVASSESEAVSSERRRIQLNPTVNPDELRAIPTYGAPTTSVPVPPPVAVDGAGMSATEAALLATRPTGPVELPRDATLDAGLEAELKAAMEGSMSASTPPTGAAPTGEASAPNGGQATGVPLTEDDVQPGAKLKAKVQSVGAEHVFCDVGFRFPGLLPVKQFPAGKQPREGEEFLVVVDAYDRENGVVQVSLPKATRRPRGNWEELQVGQLVECVVNKTNKGGLEVTVSSMRAFLPASQVDVGFVSSLDGYVGQKFTVQVTEVNPAKRNLVVSRRAVVIQERKEAATNFWGQVEVGQQYSGRVKTIKDYGAFIDLGGVDGFLHVGEMSWTRIKHPTDLLQEGQTVDVVVLSLDREKQKIGLGIRQLAQNPWNLAVDKYAVSTTVSGKVTRTTDFGAFVELEPGVEGLIHISELEHRRVKRVGEVVNVGQEVQAQVLEVNPERQRISLSLKALKAKPEEPKDEDMAPGKGQSYERKRKEPLRGGTGGTGGSGLFGNPTDYRG